jgi:hypothetical protein
LGAQDIGFIADTLQGNAWKSILQDFWVAACARSFQVRAVSSLILPNVIQFTFAR